MKARYWIGATAISLAAAVTVYATVVKTFRTTARLFTVTQTTDAVTGKPQYDFAALAGHDLVNLALGTSLDTVRTNEVLAMQIECGANEASLVVYDKSTDIPIAVIATSTSFDTVVQQDNPNADGPNRERFVAEMEIEPGGNETNGLLDGKLMVAGRLHLDPASGCPRAVPVVFDRDRLDKLFCDLDFRDPSDTDRIVRRAGHGHAIGVLDIVVDGSTNKVLVPHMQINIRRDLAD